MAENKKDQRQILLRALTFCSALPALFLGVYTMHYFQVPKSLWLMNLTFVFLGITLVLSPGKFTPVFQAIKPTPVIVVSIALLLLTFLSDGMMNVHRWVNAGNLKINIGAIVAPLLLIQMHRLAKIKQGIFLAALVTLIFLIQPDSSQVTAFSVSAALLLLANLKEKPARISVLMAVIVCLLTTWSYPDKLPPVKYVENIVQMAGEINPLLYVFSILSLLLIPLPFFTVFPEEKKLVSLSLGVYFSLTLLSTAAGNFPVMIMGYGISPIIGYYIGLIWLVKISVQ